MLTDTHTEFIMWVQERRGDRLQPEHREDIFSGASFTGVLDIIMTFLDIIMTFLDPVTQVRAVEMGLADGTYTVLEERVAGLVQCVVHSV